MEFEDIYRSYSEDVYRFVNRLCHYDSDLAVEITQETFIKTYFSFDKFKGDSIIKTWLFSIAKNLFLDIITKRKLTTTHIDNVRYFLMDSHTNIEIDAENKELLTFVLYIIFTMPVNMQDVFLSRIYSDKSYNQIAAELGISTSSAKVLVFSNKELEFSSTKKHFHHWKCFFGTAYASLSSSPVR